LRLFLLLGIFLLSCKQESSRGAGGIDELAKQYVRLALEIGKYDDRL
jgi:hypothetical protein